MRALTAAPCGLRRFAGVRAGAAVGGVGPRTTVDAIVAVTAEQIVVPRAAHEDIGRTATREYVVALAAAADLVAQVTGETDVPAEAARLRATQWIRSVVDRLRGLHPAMAAHLGKHVRTGKYCGYLPRAEDRVDWRVDRS